MCWRQVVTLYTIAVVQEAGISSTATRDKWPPEVLKRVMKGLPHVQATGLDPVSTAVLQEAGVSSTATRDKLPLEVLKEGIS